VTQSLRVTNGMFFRVHYLCCVMSPSTRSKSLTVAKSCLNRDALATGMSATIFVIMKGTRVFQVQFDTVATSKERLMPWFQWAKTHLWPLAFRVGYLSLEQPHAKAVSM
jgi:hypothetical protein